VLIDSNTQVDKIIIAFFFKIPQYIKGRALLPTAKSQRQIDNPDFFSKL